MIQREIPDKYLKSRPRPVDCTLLVITVLLIMGGLVTLFSATYYKAASSGDALLEVSKICPSESEAMRF